MRILWLTENYPPQRGGMAQSCDRIINGLRKSGIDIEIIHFTNKNEGFIRKQQQNGGYTPSAFLESDSHTLNLTWNYIKTLGSFDYVVCFGGYLSMIGAPIFSKWLDSKLVTFLRGNDFDTAIFTPRKREMMQYALEQSHQIFSVTSDKVTKVRDWLPEPKVDFIPNGIEIESWTPSKSEIEFAQNWRIENLGGKVCFGIVGQLKAKKGVQFMISALNKTNLDTKIHLLLIGELDESLAEELEQSKFTYSLMSFQDRFQLMKFYLATDAIVIPSFYDGMPNVLLEAGALGIPAIASNVDGMKDLIDHEKDGLLFEVGNEDNFRKMCYQFISFTDDDRKELGNHLKTKIHENYQAHHETSKYLKFFN